MITDINKFNELECQKRTAKISATHNFDELKTRMQQRIQEQKDKAKNQEITPLPRP